MSFVDLSGSGEQAARVTANSNRAIFFGIVESVFAAVVKWKFQVRSDSSRDIPVSPKAYADSSVTQRRFFHIGCRAKIIT